MTECGHFYCASVCSAASVEGDRCQVCHTRPCHMVSLGNGGKTLSREARECLFDDPIMMIRRARDVMRFRERHRDALGGRIRSLMAERGPSQLAVKQTDVSVWKGWMSSDESRHEDSVASNRIEEGDENPTTRSVHRSAIPRADLGPNAGERMLQRMPRSMTPGNHVSESVTTRAQISASQADDGMHTTQSFPRQQAVPVNSVPHVDRTHVFGTPSRNGWISRPLPSSGSSAIAPFKHSQVIRHAIVKPPASPAIRTSQVQRQSALSGIPRARSKQTPSASGIGGIRAWIASCRQASSLRRAPVRTISTPSASPMSQRNSITSRFAPGHQPLALRSSYAVPRPTATQPYLSQTKTRIRSSLPCSSSYR